MSALSTPQLFRDLSRRCISGERMSPSGREFCWIVGFLAAPQDLPRPRGLQRSAKRAATANGLQ